MTNTLALLMKKKIKSLKLKNKAKKLIEEENVIYDVMPEIFLIILLKRLLKENLQKILKRK